MSLKRDEWLIFIEFIANYGPSVAYVLINRPCDFMVCFNKYPEVFATVSIIQYKSYHMIYDNSDILYYIHSPTMFGNRGGNKPATGPRGTSYKNADRLIKDSEVIRLVAGSVIESEQEWAELNLVRNTADWSMPAQLMTERTTGTINDEM